MGKFGVVSDLLSSISMEKAGRDMDTVWIPREHIRKNPRNGYEISNVQELAEDIARSGLAQPLEVTPAEDGEYLLITGERRLTALDELISRGIWKKDIPCYVRPMAYYDLPLSAQAKEMYAILRTNCLNRDKSDADLYFEVTEWGKIISELKQKGYKQLCTDSGDISLQGRTREITAARAHISTGQAAKIERIQKHGHEKLQEAVREGRIRLATAYNVSLMTLEDQEAFLKQNDKADNISQEDMEAFRKNAEIAQRSLQEEVVKEFCARNSREGETAGNVLTAEERDIPATLGMSEGQGSNPKLKNDEQRREWLRKYKEWGLWYRDPNIDVNYYRHVFLDGSELIAVEYPQREHCWSEKVCDEVFYHLLEKKKEKYGGKRFNEKFRHQTTSESELVSFLRKSR